MDKVVYQHARRCPGDIHADSNFRQALVSWWFHDTAVPLSLMLPGLRLLTA